MRTIRGVIVTSPRILAALIAAATLAAFAVTTASARPQAAPNPPARLGAVAFTSARHSGQPASGRLATVAFTDTRHGYGLFTAQHRGRCRAEVGVTSDGGRRFTRPAVVTGWSCDDDSPATTLAAGQRGDVFLFGPALFTSQDGGRAWHRARPGGPVLALAAAGRSAWALVARCHGHGQPTGQLTGQRTGQRTGQCPVRLIVSANGGRTWQAARLPGASVPSLGGQPAGPAELVRTSARTAYVLTSPGPASRLWITRDGGASWTRRPVPCGLEAMSAALAVAPDGTIVVVCAGEPSAGGQVKTLAWSADGGRTWTVHRPCRTASGSVCAPLGYGYLGQIAAPAGRTVFLAGARSSLLVTRDGGRAWNLVRPVIGDSGGGTGALAFFGQAGRASQAAQASQASQDGVVFGYDSRHNERPAIWHTADGGAHWRVVYPVLT